MCSFPTLHSDITKVSGITDRTSEALSFVDRSREKRMWIAIIFVTDRFYLCGLKFWSHFFSILKKNGKIRAVPVGKGNTGPKRYGVVWAKCTGPVPVGKGNGGGYWLVWASKAKRYGAGTGKLVWGQYRLWCRHSTGPTHSLCAAHTVKYMGPLRVTVLPIVGSVGTACTMPSLCPYQPHTGMFAGVDMMVQTLLKPILFFSYIHVLA